MKKLDYTVAWSKPKEKGSSCTILDVLPLDGAAAARATLNRVGCKLTPTMFAELKATSLEVSATGVRRRMFFGARHSVTIEVSCERPR